MPEKVQNMTPNSNTVLTVSRSLMFPEFHAFGERTDANGNNVDCWIGPTAIQPEPETAGYQPNLISSSANDAVDGGGVSQIDVDYLDVNGAEQNEVVTLTGLTQKLMVATDVMFINSMHTVEVDGAGLVAAGNIDARNSTTVVQRIEAAGNEVLSTMRQVPAGKNLFLEGWHAEGMTAAGGKVAKLRIRSSWHRDDAVNQPGIYHFFDVSKAKDTTSGWLLFPRPILIGPLATIKISTWTIGTMDISGSWSGWLEDV